MIARFCILALTAFALAALLAPLASSPASACSHHEKYDGA